MLGMTMVGVTGTNGKTTTTYLLEAIVKAAQALMAKVDPQAAAQGKFNININVTLT